MPLSKYELERLNKQRSKSCNRKTRICWDVLIAWLILFSIIAALLVWMNSENEKAITYLMNTHNISRDAAVDMILEDE